MLSYPASLPIPFFMTGFAAIGTFVVFMGMKEPDRVTPKENFLEMDNALLL